MSQHSLQSHFILLVVLLMCLLESVYPQNDQSSVTASQLQEEFSQSWRWVHFTQSSGLPSNHIVDIIETDDGTPWAIMKNSIAWYDGYKWHEVGSPVSKLLMTPFRVSKDRKNSILVSLPNHVFRCSPGRIDTVAFSKQLNVGFGSVVPLDSSRYLGHHHKKVFAFDKESKKDLKTAPLVAESELPSFIRTSVGSIWASSISGLYRFDGSTWKLINASTRQLRIRQLVELRSRSVYMAIDGPLEFRGFWQIRLLDSNKTVVHRVDPLSIRSFDIFPSKEIIAIHRNNEIFLFQNSAWIPISIPPNLFGLDLSVLLLRTNGDVWIGTSEGLFLCRRSLQRWSNKVPDTLSGFSGYINEIFKAKDNSIWLATGDGLKICHLNGEVQSINSINDQQLVNVTGIAQDHQDNIWIGSGSGFDGAYRWDGNQWKHFGREDGLNAIRIHKIEKDLDGNLWFLGIGIHDSLPDPGAFQYSNGVFHEWGVKQGLINGRVYAFVESRTGARWFGTDGGISRWKDGIWKHWTVSEELPYSSIFCLALDQYDQVWFGNRFSGCGYIDNNDSLHFFGIDDGLISPQVWDLAFDSIGVLWVSTWGGLCRFKDGIWSQFDRASGLNHLELWPILPFVDMIYIGTNGAGVNILNRDEEYHPTPRVEAYQSIVEDRNALLLWRAYAFWGQQDPENIMTRYRLDVGQWSAWSTDNEVLLENLPIGDHRFQLQAKSLFGRVDSLQTPVVFTIQPPLFLRPMIAGPIGLMLISIVYLTGILVARRRHHLELLRENEVRLRTVMEHTPAAIFILHPRDLRIRYANSYAERLVGSPRENLNNIPITDFLKEGAATQVLFHANEVPSNKPGRSEGILTARHGGTYWVELTVGFIHYHNHHALLVTCFDISQRKKDEADLRHLTSELVLTEERERRRMATYLHDNISQALAFCKIKLDSLFDASASDETRRQLSTIDGMIEELIERSRSLTFELSPPILYELNFEEALEWLADRYRHQHGLSITVHSNTTLPLLPENVRVFLFQSTRELLANIVKHAHATTVTITIECFTEFITLSVSDNGVGFDASTTPGHSTIKGFGLLNIRERLRHLGGDITFESTPGCGTIVKLRAAIANQSDEGHPS